jgi:hypothetical protein
MDIVNEKNYMGFLGIILIQIRGQSLSGVV